MPPTISGGPPPRVIGRPKLPRFAVPWTLGSFRSHGDAPHRGIWPTWEIPRTPAVLVVDEELQRLAHPSQCVKRRWWPDHGALRLGKAFSTPWMTPVLMLPSAPLRPSSGLANWVRIGPGSNEGLGTGSPGPMAACRAPSRGPGKNGRRGSHRGMVGPLARGGRESPNQGPGCHCFCSR